MRPSIRVVGVCPVLVMMLLLLAGCGGNRTPNTEAASTPAPEKRAPATAAVSTPASDPCALLTDEDIQTAIGMTAEGHSSVSGGAKVCTWTDATGKSAIVQVYSTMAGYEASRKAFESFYGAMAEKVEGLGDEACYVAGKTASMPTATFCLRKGSSAASVQVMAVTEDLPALRPQTLALARILSDKL